MFTAAKRYIYSQRDSALMRRPLKMSTENRNSDVESWDLDVFSNCSGLIFDNLWVPAARCFWTGPQGWCCACPASSRRQAAGWRTHPGWRTSPGVRPCYAGAMLQPPSQPWMWFSWCRIMSWQWMDPALILDLSCLLASEWLPIVHDQVHFCLWGPPGWPGILRRSRKKWCLLISTNV